jgi:hypothetical protein
MSVRLAVVAALLAAQCGIAVWQHLGSTRYFAWAPNDYLMTYNLHVRVGGRQLTPVEMSQRYRLSLNELLSPRMRSELSLAPDERYVWQDPAAEVTSRIRRVEERRPNGPPVNVVLRYQLDAGPLRTWRWP